MLHLTAGDINAGRLAEAALPGRVVACIDVLHEGPTPAGLGGAAWRELRAEFVAARGWAAREDALARLADADAAVDAARAEDEVVLWFEHDLVCQLMMVRLLDRLRAQVTGRLTLVCIGGYPGVPSFRALGDLDAAQIRALFAERPAVTAHVAEGASAAWSAFTAPDPMAVADLAARAVPGLPYLAPALRRHLEQFPSTREGLGRTERSILERLADGPIPGKQLYGVVQSREATPFMTDLIFFGYLDDLMTGRHPLVAADGETVRLTQAGRDVLAGAVDAIDARGIDRWLGGVHVESPPAPDRRPVWRWNAPETRVEVA